MCVHLVDEVLSGACGLRAMSANMCLCVLGDVSHNTSMTFVVSSDNPMRPFRFRFWIVGKWNWCVSEGGFAASRFTSNLDELRKGRFTPAYCSPRKGVAYSSMGTGSFIRVAVQVGKNGCFER